MAHRTYDTGIKRGDPAPRLLSDRPHIRVNSRGGNHKTEELCNRCGNYDECHERQRMGLWVLCEVPDELDFMMIRLMEL